MPSRRVWLRAGLTTLAIAALAPVGPVVISGFLPNLPVLRNVSRLVVPWLPWLVLVSALAAVVALLATRVDGRRLQKVVAAVAVLTLAGASVMTARVSLLTPGGGSISWVRAAGVGSTPMPSPDDEEIYWSTPEFTLHGQLWRPAGAPGSAPKAIALFVHGGSFTSGGLDGHPWLFRSWADQGLFVVDVEYRLAPPPRWDQAPGDVLCALAWAEERGRDWTGSNPAPPVVLIGDSAGGNLALMAAYAAGTSDGKGSCGADPVAPAAVVAIEPAADLAGIWADASVPDRLGTGTFPETYIGGTPAEYPQRYDAASPLRLIRQGIPPTLILAAENDHLILTARTANLAHRLATAGVSCQIVVVPYAEHGIAAGPDDYGEQLQEAIVPAYIDRVVAGMLASTAQPYGPRCA